MADEKRSNFRSRELAILLWSQPWTEFDSCSDEARRIAVEARTTVIFIHGGRSYMWSYDESTGTVSKEIH